jgi:hypothetical protein
MNRETEKTGAEIDLSPQVVERRLRDWGQLFKLAMSLRKARWVGKVEDIRRATADPETKTPQCPNRFP